MAAFFKSDLFRNFLGGFLLGTVLVFVFDTNEAIMRESATPPAATAFVS